MSVSSIHRLVMPLSRKSGRVRSALRDARVVPIPAILKFAGARAVAVMAQHDHLRAR